MEPRLLLRNAHEGSVLCVAFNAHRREVITGGQDGAIKAWALADGKQLRTLADGHLGWVTGMVYASSLRVLFSTSIDSNLIVWDTRAKCEWWQRIKMEGQGHCVEWDARRALVYVGSERVVRVYAVLKDNLIDPSRRRPILKWAHTIKGVHDGYVRAIVCTDSGRLFSAGYDASLCLYEVVDATASRPVQFTHTTQHNCHAGAISCCAFDWENNLLLTGSFDKSVKVWSPEGKLLQTYGPFADTLTGLCHVPATRMLWMSANSTAPIVYDPRTGTNVTTFKQPPTVRSLVRGGAADDADEASVDKPTERLLRLFSLRGTTEVVGTTSTRDLIVWRYNSTGAASVLVGHTDWVDVVCYARKFELEVGDEPQVRLFSGGSDALVRTWEPTSRLNAALYAQTGKSAGHTGAILSGTFCDDCNAFVTGSDDCTIRIWFQPSTISAVAAVRERYRRAIMLERKETDEGDGAGAAARNGEEKAVGTPAAEAAPAAEGAPASDAPAASPAADAAERANGGGVGGGDGEGEEAAEDQAAAAEAADYVEASCVVLEGHEERVTGMVVLGPPAAPCTLVSVSWDLSIRWWRLLPAEHVEPLLHTIENAHDDHIHGIAYAPLTHQIATCSSDQGVKVWDAQARTLAATLSGHRADVTHVAWSVVHAVWVTGSDDQTIRLWSTLGRQLRLINVRDAVSALAIDLNHGFILAACNGKGHELRVYYSGLDPQPGDEDSEGSALGGARADTGAEPARDEREREREREPYLLHAHRGHTDCIRRIVHVPEKGQYLSAGWDRTIRTWRQAGPRKKPAVAVGGSLASAQAGAMRKARDAPNAAGVPPEPAVPAATAAAAAALAASKEARAAEAGKEEAEAAAGMSFADRYPLQVPKSLQNEFGGFEAKAAAAPPQVVPGMPVRRLRKAAPPAESASGQSGMALRLNELLAEREAMLEAQLLNARAGESRDKLQSAQSTLRGAKRGGLGAMPRGDLTRLSANSHRSSTERELRTSERSMAGLCRAEADRLYKRRSELGQTRLVCIVKEDVDGEIEAFEKDVWPGGEILMDKDLAFFKALGGGSYDQKSILMFLAKLVLPGTQLKQNIAQSKGYTNNFVGEGLIVGGLFVLRKGGAIEYAHREEEIGTHAPLEDAIAAAKRASEAK